MELGPRDMNNNKKTIIYTFAIIIILVISLIIGVLFYHWNQDNKLNWYNNVLQNECSAQPEFVNYKQDIFYGFIVYGCVKANYNYNLTLFINNGNNGFGSVIISNTTVFNYSALPYCDVSGNYTAMLTRLNNNEIINIAYNNHQGTFVCDI